MMKKLYAFAFYTLVTPLIAFDAGSVSAQQSVDQQIDGDRVTYPQTDASRINTAGEGSLVEDRGYFNSAPYSGMQASTVIGTEVKTADDENVGPVDDLIINENGQVVAIVVGVGGFLGLAEKAVAIDWDDISKSDISADDLELRIAMTREDLLAAPEFVSQD